jgi:hypothetical protein
MTLAVRVPKKPGSSTEYATALSSSVAAETHPSILVAKLICHHVTPFTTLGPPIMVPRAPAYCIPRFFEVTLGLLMTGVSAVVTTPLPILQVEVAVVVAVVAALVVTVTLVDFGL